MSSDTIAVRFPPMTVVRSPKISVPLVLAFGIGALLVGIAGFSVSPKLGILALGLPIAPFFVLAPDKALLLLVAVVPFDAIVGKGVISASGTLTSATGGTLTRLVGVAVMGGWVVHLMVQRKRVRTGIAGYILFAFVGLAAASLAWTVDPDSTIRRLRTVVQLAFLYLMLSNLLNTEAAMRRTIDVLLASTAMMALAVILQFSGAGDFARASLSGGDARTDANFLAANLVLPVVMAVAIGGQGPFGWWRWLAILPIGGATFITGSRGGIVALAAGLMVLCCFRPRLGLRIASAAMAMVLTFGLIAPRTFVDELVDRFTHAGDDRLSGRVDIWHVGVTAIADRPLLGTGFGAFSSVFQKYMRQTQVDASWARASVHREAAPHNMYIGTTAELGVLGAALLIAAMAAHAFGLWMVVRRTVRWRFPPAVPLAVLGGLATLLTLGFSIDLMLFKPMWVLLGFAQATIVAFAPLPASGQAAGARAPAVPARRVS